VLLPDGPWYFYQKRLCCAPLLLRFPGRALAWGPARAARRTSMRASPLAQVAHPPLPDYPGRPESVESAPRRLAAMAYGHSRLNPAESRRSMQL
jgi:hypothetical protein